MPELSLSPTPGLAGLIEDLSKPDPDDPAPSITRAHLAYLRILAECGPEEMYQAILTNLQASVASIYVATRNTEVVIAGMERMLAGCAKTWRAEEAALRAKLRERTSEGTTKS